LKPKTGLKAELKPKQSDALVTVLVSDQV